MISHVDSEIARELSHARDRLLKWEGAVEQAERGVESARASHRRAVEARDAERDLVGRLERELREGAHRRPLIAAAEAAAERNGHAEPNTGIHSNPASLMDSPADPPPPRSDDGRRPGETVRAYRERRKAERTAAGRPIRASGPQALEEFDAAREAIAGGEKPRGTHQSNPHQDHETAVAEERPDGGPIARQPAGAPPAGGAIPIRPEDLVTIREAIDEIEGPAGDGTRTRICSRCREAWDEELYAACPSCSWTISRSAADVLAISAPPAGAGPVMLATGGTGRERYVWAIHNRPWDADSIRRAVEAIEGEGGDGTASRVCSGCGAVRACGVEPCPKCRDVASRVTIGVMVDVGAEPAATAESVREKHEPDYDGPPAAGRASGAARRKRAKGRKEGARAK